MGARIITVVAAIIGGLIAAVVYTVVTQTSGHHIYNDWPMFKTWMDQSNWSSLVVAIVIPGVFTYGFVTWQHRKSRDHTERHARELHTKLDLHHERQLQLSRLLHSRLGGSDDEWEERLVQIPPPDDPVYEGKPPRKG